MKLTTTFLVLFLVCSWAVGQTGIPVATMSHCDNEMLQFLNTYDIPGGTMALSRNGKLVYMRAFGKANLAETEATQPYHLFRIASVSKPITAIAIMKMVEAGQLNLSDKVFGSNGIFANNAYFNSATVADNRLYDVTVQHLLEHTGGWNRDVNCVPSPTSPYLWAANSCDPIVFPLHVTQTLGEPNPVTERALIKFLMGKNLDFAPGTAYAYSNIGYLTLGLIIEEISGQSYEDYVKTKVLAPLGIYDMHLGKNLLADKQEREGEYHGNGYTAPSVYGTGVNVPWEYGGGNLEAMDAHGGWIATARDLVRLLVAIDGFSTKPDILSGTSINTMTTGSTANSNYAKGWSVNQFGNWWHIGAMDGTASFWARSSGGYTWAIILNKRVIDGSANAFWGALDNLPWSCISQTTTYPTHDLMDFPKVAATELNFKGTGGTELNVNWKRGSGNQVMLVARESSAAISYPLDGTDYTADASYGVGDDLGNGNFVVYQGTGTSVDLTGLDPAKTYTFRLYEFNRNATTGMNALYLLPHAPTEDATTASATRLETLRQLGIDYFPNPAHEQMEIRLSSPNLCDRVELRNLQGRVVRTVALNRMQHQLSLRELPAQLYLISFYKSDQYLGSGKLLKQ